MTDRPSAAGMAAFCAFFALALACVVAGFLIPMERAPYQITHPSTYAPVMIEGGLAFVLILAALGFRPGFGAMAAALWAGAATWAVSTWYDQNFVDFFLRVPMGIAFMAAALFCLKARSRTPARAAAAMAFVQCLAVTLFVHYAFLFPINERIDVDRLAAVDRAMRSASPMSSSECQAAGFSCFPAAGPYPDEVPAGDRQMLASYVPHAASLKEWTLRRSVAPDAVNVLSDYRLYGVGAHGGEVFAAMSGKRHLIENRIIANNGMMATLGAFFAVSSGILLWKGARRS